MTAMFIVIRFDKANHQDNEQTACAGPFATMDDAYAYAVHNVKFYHVVQLRGGEPSMLKVCGKDQRPVNITEANGVTK